MNDREMLQMIDPNDKEALDALTEQMGLVFTDKLKLQVILKKVPREKRGLDVCHISILMFMFMFISYYAL